ncbi:DUF3566 domain-containing protein [Geodermatophilus sp. SYSU D00697]
MSDRTQGSVRTGSRPGDTSSATGTATGRQTDGTAPVTATQAIPDTGAQRAQSATDDDGTAPVAAGPVTSGAGSSAVTSAPAETAALAPAPDSSPVGGAPGQAVAGQGAAAPAAAAPAAAAPAAAASAAAKGSGKQKAARGPRRARLQLRHIDTWSALKISLVLSIAMFFIWMVAVGVLYGVLSGLGVFETLNDLFGQLGTASGGEGGSEVITPGIVFGGAAVIGAINIVLMTALCTVAAFIYNMCSDLVGGLEVTLSERD